MRPKMSERPAAIRAYTQPMRRPERRAWATTSAVTCGGSEGRRRRVGGVPGRGGDASRPAPGAATASPGLGTTLAGRRREHDEPDALDRPPLAALQRGDVLVTIGTSDSGLPRRRWRFLD